MCAAIASSVGSLSARVRPHSSARSLRVRIGSRCPGFTFPRPGTAVVDIDFVLEAYGALPSGLAPAPDGTLRTSLLQVFVRTGDEWLTVGYYNVDLKR